MIGKFIVKIYQIDALDAMVRSTLALDAPNDYDTLDLNRGPLRGEAKLVSNGYVKRSPLCSDTM